MLTKNTTVTYALHEVIVHLGGSLTVHVSATPAGFEPKIQTFEITQEEALPVWGSMSDPTKNRWDDLCDVLYEILVTRGDITL